MGEGGMLTLAMPYYLNPGQLALQYRNWLEWPGKYRKQLKVIIVDDGSPNSPAANVPRPYGLPELEIYRVLEDRPWHQHAARNLGAHVAPEGWLLLTDMDHVLEADAAAQLFKAMAKGKLDAGTVYMLDRIEADTRLPTLGKDNRPKPHPNSFVLTRETYWRIGGYDERATGIYGTDKLFRERAFAAGQRGHLHIPLTRYWRDIVPDASTTTLPRKEGRDPAQKARVAAEIAADPQGIVTLNFPWERVV
jgi:hypothetical protein